MLSRGVLLSPSRGLPNRISQRETAASQQPLKLYFIFTRWAEPPSPHTASHIIHTVALVLLYTCIHEPLVALINTSRTVRYNTVRRETPSALVDLECPLIATQRGEGSWRSRLLCSGRSGAMEEFLYGNSTSATEYWYIVLQ